MFYRYVLFLWNGGPSSRKADPNELRRRRTLSTASFIAMFVGSAVIVLNALTDANELDNTIILAGISALFLNLHLQSYANRPILAAYLMVLGYWAVVTIEMANYNLSGHTWVWLVYVPLLAVLLLDFPGAIYWTLLPILSLWGYTLIDPNYSVAIEGSLIIVISAFTAYFFKRNYESANASLADALRNLSVEKEKKEGAENLLNDMISSVNMSTYVMDHMNEGIIMVTPNNGVIVYSNRRFGEMFGYEPDELYGRHVSILNADTDNSNAEEVANDRIQEVRSTGYWSGTILNKKKDDSTFWTRATITNFEHSYHGPVLLSIQQDITQAKQVEDELIVSRKLLQKAQKISSTGHWTYNIGTKQTSGSDALYDIYEVSRGGKTLEFFLNLVHPDDKQKCAEVLNKGIKNQDNWSIEHRIITPGGKQKWVQAIGEVEPISDGVEDRLILGTVQDITARKLMEEVILSGKRRLEATQRLAKIGSWELDLISNKLEWSQEVFDIFEISSDKFAATYEAFLENIHPDDRDIVNNTYLDSLNNKQPYRIEHRLLLKNGSEKIVTEFCESYFDMAGNPLRSIGMIQDVTEQRAAEKEKSKLESQLRHAQKIEAIGILAGGIAHDLNNMLTPIMGYTNLAVSLLPKSNPVQEELMNIEKGVIRASELIDQILLFSKQAPRKLSPVKLRDIISECMSLLRSSMPASIRVKLDIDGCDNHILGDPSQMHQVVLNLCTNACYVMEEEGGTLTVKLDNISLDEISAKQYPSLNASEYIHMSIVDTGPGISSKDMERIFEPFFTTKPFSKGTGLGLSVAHGIVADHDGAIAAESIPGKGTTFHVYLPIHETTALEIQPEKHRILEGGTESIMIIDDDVHVLSVMKAMLEKLGYLVTTYTDSVIALEDLSRATVKCDIVVSDLNMPNITGLELAKHMIQNKINMPLIIISGNRNLISVEIARDLNIRRVLGKPIAMKELADTIREVLDQKIEATSI